MHEYFIEDSFVQCKVVLPPTKTGFKIYGCGLAVYKLQIGKFMYQYKSGLLPYSFNNMFLVTRRSILMALEVQSFFIYLNVGLI